MFKHFIIIFASFPLVANAELSLIEEKTLQKEFQTASKEQGAVMFMPPEGWHLADPKGLPPNIKVMVVGRGAHEYPPSINLAFENYAGTLKEYLKIVENINKRRGADWKDLGKIKTEAGEASLSQVDSKTKWGMERQMHVIFIKDGTVYILTAAALKDEFPNFYKEFFKAMQSLKINS